MNLPAICNKCGFAFPSGIVVENVRGLTLEGNSAGPCPRCGSWGHIPDGKFNVMNKLIEIIDAPESTIKELKQFAEIIKKIRNDQDVSVDSILSEIESETPIFSGIKEYFPQNREEKREDLKFFIGILITIISLVIQLKTSSNTTNNINIDTIINNVYELNENEIDFDIIDFQSGKIERNKPCPCGSGKKYKKCHGDWRRKINESVTISGELD